MALAALAPSRGHTGLGSALTTIQTVSTATAATNPVSAVVAGASSLISGIENLFGGTSRFASSNYEGAEASRANSYLLGVAIGYVQAGQYLLGQLNSDSSKYAQQFCAQILAAAQSNYPQIMAQAQAAGMLHDAADGSGGLQLLVNAGAPYTNQYAGYSTDTGLPPSGNTAILVQKLAQNAATGTGTATIPGTSIPLPGGLSGASMPLLLGAGLLVAIFLGTRPKPRRGES